MRDYVPGQLTVTMENGREFAVIRGRRWTRVPEYLSNGQLTARFFVDEATGEVRQADSWKKPKTWPLPESAAVFARDIIAKAELASALNTAIREVNEDEDLGRMRDLGLIDYVGLGLWVSSVIAFVVDSIRRRWQFRKPIR